MSKKKLQTGVLFLDKTRFDIYLPDKKQIIPFEFKSEIIKDSEVLDHELLYNQLKPFIETNKFTASSLIIVLSKNVLFEKDFIKGQETDEQQQILAQQFLDNVPFESVGSKTVHLEKGFKVIAANADLYESIMGIFEQSGFTVSALLPVSLFGGNIESLNANTVKVLLQKADSLKRYTLATDSGDFIIKKGEEETVKKKNYMMIIAGVGMILAAAGLIVYAIYFLK